jgi:hypothetical protein
MRRRRRLEPLEPLLLERRLLLKEGPGFGDIAGGLEG